jgi:hypothetical protein
MGAAAQAFVDAPPGGVREGRERCVIGHHLYK